MAKLDLLDIIYIDTINVKQLLGSIINKNTREIKFNFTIEIDDLNIQKKAIEDDDDALFVRGKLNINGIAYPITAIS